MWVEYTSRLTVKESIMSRRIHVIGNWKMNHDAASATEFLSELSALVDGDLSTMGIAAPAALLAQCAEQAPGSLSIYGQNSHKELSGAYTGENSASLLKSVGCAGVVLDHSERREYFGESDALILDKTRTAQSQGLSVIYCCGEPLEIRKAGTHVAYVGDQLRASVLKMQENELDSLMIAYEPIWAIGTGETATAEQAEEMCREIRDMISEQFGADLASRIIILYGGSVKPANAAQIFAQQNVDGGLVGGASLKADSFAALIEIARG